MGQAFLDRITQRFWWLPFGRVPEVSPSELQARIEGPVPPQILDVRTHLEWRRSRIAGAHSVPIGGLRGQMSRLDPNRPVVAICLSAHRSIPAVRLLQHRGFRDVTQLAGGMIAWWRAGLPTTG